MKCKYCGEEIANDSKFCEHCGTKQVKSRNVKAWIFALTMVGAVLLFYLIKFIDIGTNDNDINVKVTGQVPYGEPVVVGYVDLGLPSGTLWNENNEDSYYTFDEAIQQFGSQLPNQEQWEELVNNCSWTWVDNGRGKGYRVVGPNDNYIFLPICGYYDCDGNFFGTRSHAIYWSSTPGDSDDAFGMYLDSKYRLGEIYYRCLGCPVRLVH